MTDRPSSVAFDRVAHEYDDTRGGEPRGRRYAELIAPHLPDGRLLEVGVGTGVIAFALQARGRDVVGVDLSVPMLARARDRLGARVVQGDAQRLPFASASVDAAYCCWVLHLVADVGAVLAEVARVLRPGGRFVVLPSASQPPRDADDAFAARWWQVQGALGGGHGRQDHPQRLRELAPAAGFRCAEVLDVPGEPLRQSPAETIRQIESRTFSMLWDVTDAQWAEHVEPVLADLRTQPDQDRPRTRETRVSVVLLDRA